MHNTAYQYAKALFTISEKQADSSQVLDSLKQLVHLYRKNAHFRFVLISKRIKRKNKIQIVRAVLSEKISLIILEMLEILCERDSVNQLSDISEQFSRLVSESNDFSNVSVELSAELGKDEINNLERSLKNSLKKEIKFKVTINPKLIGGLVLRVDDRIIDGSIKTQLEKVRKHLILN